MDPDTYPTPEDDYRGYEDHEDREWEDDEDELEDATEWKPGECDMCAGPPRTLAEREAALASVIVPVCACWVGQGVANRGDCLCGPELFEGKEPSGTPQTATTEPPGAYCACSDPDCPTPEGQYTHGKAEQMTEEAAAVLARVAWPEAEGFEPAPGGWTFRVGAGYASVTNSGQVAEFPQGTRSDAKRFMGK